MIVVPGGTEGCGWQAGAAAAESLRRDGRPAAVVSSLEGARTFLDALPDSILLNAVGVVPQLSGRRPPFAEDVVSLYGILKLVGGWRGGDSSVRTVLVAEAPQATGAGSPGPGMRLDTWEQLFSAHCERLQCLCPSDGGAIAGAGAACENCLSRSVSDASASRWFWRGSLHGRLYVAMPCLGGSDVEPSLPAQPFSAGSTVQVLERVPMRMLARHQWRWTGVALHPGRPGPQGAGGTEEALLCMVNPGDDGRASPVAVALVPEDGRVGVLRAYCLASLEEIDGAIVAACAAASGRADSGGGEGEPAGMIDVRVPSALPVVGASKERMALLLESCANLEKKIDASAPLFEPSVRTSQDLLDGGLPDRWPELAHLWQQDSAAKVFKDEDAPEAPDGELQELHDAWAATVRQVTCTFDSAGSPVELAPACPETSAGAETENGVKDLAGDPALEGAAGPPPARHGPGWWSWFCAVKSAGWLLERLPDGDGGYAEVPLQERCAQGWRHEAARQERLPLSALGSQVLHGVELFRPLASHRRREIAMANASLKCEVRCGKMGHLHAMAALDANEVFALTRETEVRSRVEREVVRKRLSVIRQMKKKYRIRSRHKKGGLSTTRGKHSGLRGKSTAQRRASPRRSPRRNRDGKMR